MIKKNPGCTSFWVSHIDAIHTVSNASAVGGSISSVPGYARRHIDDIRGELAVGNIPQDFVAQSN